MKSRQQLKRWLVEVSLNAIGIIIVAVMAVAFIDGAARYVEKVAAQQYGSQTGEVEYAVVD